MAAFEAGTKKMMDKNVEVGPLAMHTWAFSRAKLRLEW